MRTLSIIALSTALALSSAAPGHAWVKKLFNKDFVDWANKAKNELKNPKCWRNPYDNKCD